MRTETTENRMTDPIPARLATLKTMALPDLKAEWRALFRTEPPGYNRRFLESRLAYRIQELAYGGLKPETHPAARGARRASRRQPSPAAHPPRGHADRRHAADPGVAGRRAHRDGADRGFEWQGRPTVALGDRPGDHRDPMEWLGFLWPESQRSA